MKLLLIFISILLFTSCATTKQPIKPMETYDSTIEKPSISSIVIPIIFDPKDIENLLNKKISGTLYEDNDMSDDGLMMKAVKSKPISIKLSGLSMEYRVPIKLDITKDIKISNIKTEGEIAINFKTDIHIKENWTIEPQTTITGYDWIEAPKVKTSIVDLPVKYIANILMNKFKNELCLGIDNNIKKNVDIKGQVDDMWKMLQDPVKVNEEYNSWMKLTPQTITMTPLFNKGNALQTMLSVTTISEVSVGSPSVFRSNTIVPPFKFASASGDEFNINIDINIPIEEAQKIAKRQMVGQEFGEGNKKVKVIDIALYGQGSKMIINAAFLGSYKGSLFIYGTPVFNPEKNAVEFTDLDYDLETKNFMLKSAKWLFSKTILNRLKENMVFPLESNLNTMKQTIAKEYSDYDVNSNVKMKCNLQTIQVESVKLIPGNIRVKVSSKGKLTVNFVAH
jgi:hypothetical protein